MILALQPFSDTLDAYRLLGLTGNVAERGSNKGPKSLLRAIKIFKK